MTADTAIFPETEVRKALRTLSMLSGDWSGEVPLRIHESQRDGRGNGAAPPFAPEFIGYIGTLTCKNPECGRCRRKETTPPRDMESYRTPEQNHRTRATRAFRKLRRYAPLEYDVLWMAVMYHLTVVQIADRLNDRAVAKGFSDRYRPADVVVLFIAGADKLDRWF